MSKWFIQRAEIRITVVAKTSAAEELVLSALNALKPQAVKTMRGIKLVVDKNENTGEWLFDDPLCRITKKIKHAGDLIYHLTDRIVFHIADKTKHVHCLHAAAVASNEFALVIPANSGSGKSSFTTWLVANGFAYLTDELILIDAQHRILSVGRPIQIKTHGIDAVQSLLLDPNKIYPGKLANAITVEALGGKVSEHASHKLAMMIFPQYKKGTGYQLNKLSAADAGMSLMGNHVNARNLKGHGFREMMSIIRNTACYSLEYGGFDQLPKDFDLQLKEMLSSAKI